MSTSPHDSLSQLPHKVREAAGDFRLNWAQWRRDVRANPALLFRSLPVRIVCWLALAVGLYFAVTRIMSAVAPDSAAGREEPTRIATIYVACTDPECGRSALVNPPVDFKAWPMTCEACKKPTTYRASLCRKCGKWIAAAPGQPSDCMHCRRAAELKRPASKPARKESGDPDDREDGWGG